MRWACAPRNRSKPLEIAADRRAEWPAALSGWCLSSVSSCRPRARVPHCDLFIGLSTVAHPFPFVLPRHHTTMSRTESVAGDPVLGSDVAVLVSPSRSRAASRMPSILSEPSTPSESDPLLGGQPQKKPFYRPRPLW